MTASYSIIGEVGDQSGTEDSFVGGKPKLPRDAQVPQCALCGGAQTFFLQLAFPLDHAWAGHSLAFFACTGCADERFLIPQMLSVPLFGADVSGDFLASYQRNFQFIVFETSRGSLVVDYPARVRFQPIRLIPGSGSRLGHLGGKPAWILEDETPGLISGSPSVFLMQLQGNIEFPTVRGTARQMELGLTGKPEPSPYDHYTLFIGNATYLFGTPAPTSAVYAITQVP